MLDMIYQTPNTNIFVWRGEGMGFFSDSPGINKSEVIECKTKRNLRKKK
jgi:hypothetical protein